MKVEEHETLMMSLKMAPQFCLIFLLMISGALGNQRSVEYSNLNLYSPKNVYISFSTIPSEGISVTLTCSSDANPPVESYTWFKENEASPVGSGQSYRALLNVPYYCKAQNNLGSERSATVFITITIGSDVSINVYVAVGLGLFALAVLLSALFWLRCRRQKNNPDEGDYQNVGPSAKDDTYAALDPADRKSDDVYQTLAY
ncbi:B-cell receptor CD22-like [Silurus meridionalis]|uniref:B-cell receptor CD22-like n=1 Tax=Silurus meridionalis TaxID=175797 RepID=UPI001EEAD267|nr:B-cell receptor CD22-like [Silurus meridionalis]